MTAFSHQNWSTSASDSVVLVGMLVESPRNLINRMKPGVSTVSSTKYKRSRWITTGAQAKECGEEDDQVTLAASPQNLSLDDLQGR
jgi:hypothetical protein